MRDIIEKMNDELPESFLWNHIFLPAHMTKAPDNRGAAIQAILFLAFWGVAHNKFLLKINTSTVIKKYATGKSKYIGA